MGGKTANRGEWLRETVFGLNDGLVTILVLIMSASTVTTSTSLIKIAWAAILAGAVSMAGGGLLSGTVGRLLLLRRGQAEQNVTLLAEAHDIHLGTQALQVGSAFILGGLVPSLPVFFGWPAFRWWSYGLSALAALLFGLLNARYTGGGFRRTIGMALLFFAVVSVGTVAGVCVGWLFQQF